MTTEHEFDRDTRVQPAGDDAFTATITDRWSAIGARPNGGYVLAICLQALRTRMPLPDPLAVSAHFLRPAVAGPAEIRTELVRVGRRAATGEVTLSQEGREIVRALATFTDLARGAGRTLVLGAMPELPPPDAAIDLLEGRSVPGVTMTERFDYRVAAPPGWVQGTPTGNPSMPLCLRFRDGRDADPLALVALADAVWPAVLEIGELGSATVELTVHVRARPAPGWLACRVTTRYVIGGFHEEDFEIWDSAGRLVAQSRQLALLA